MCNKPVRRNLSTVPLDQKVAARLKEYIGKHYKAELPPLRELSLRLGVSAPTLARAMHLLAFQGIIEIHPRKRARVKSAAPALLTLKTSHRSAERLFATFRASIATGSLPTGEPFPKVSYCARLHHVSDRTIRHVYKRLVDDGLAHYQGRRILAGPAPTAMARVETTSSHMAILVVTSKASSWTNLCRSGWNGQFGRAFVREADRQGVRLFEVAATPEMYPTGLIAGAERAELLINQLGTSFLGAVIASPWNLIPDSKKWVNLLTHQEHRAVWFDWADQGIPSELKLSSLYRCHYSETRMAAAAIEYLANQGHRKIGYSLVKNGDWQEQRFRALQTQAKNLATIEIDAYRPVSNDYEQPLEKGLFERIDWLYKNGTPLVINALDNFRASRDSTIDLLRIFVDSEWQHSTWAGLIAFMRAHKEKSIATASLPHRAWIGPIWGGMGILPAFRAGASVLIGPNDAISRSYMLNWVKDLHLQVPSDISLLSFDNAFRDSFIQLTTIDPGFDRLGYQAFHTILGDIPTDADRAGNIAIRPQVIGRGSVKSMR